MINRSRVKKLFVFSMTALLISCSAVNQPVNLSSKAANTPDIANPERVSTDTYVALAFSGGGTRATAFGHGMLLGLREATATTQNPDGILNNVRLVTGVSGGSVTAANFGLKGPQALKGFRENFLLLDGEKYMANVPFNPITIVRGLSGGVNSLKTFGRFLDETLFNGATFNDLRKRSAITTWINASDVANQTTFLFSPETFNALCSDFGSYKISHAVAASAAFPLVFSPVVLKPHHGACDYQEPDWLTTARYNPEATSAMQAYAKALESYSDPEAVTYLKLLDGGITDNFGTTGLAVVRARSQNAFSPLTPKEAVNMKRMLFIVANAATEQDFRWTKKVRGPGGLQMGMAIANSAMGAATRTAYDAMRLQVANWERELVEARCAMPSSQVRSLRGSTAGWNCSDVKFFVGQVSFAGLPDEMRDELNEIPTRLRLKANEVDLAIKAGRQATLENPELNGFLRASKAGESSAITALRKPGGASPRLITPVKN